MEISCAGISNYFKFTHHQQNLISLNLIFYANVSLFSLSDTTVSIPFAVDTFFQRIFIIFYPNKVIYYLLITVSPLLQTEQLLILLLLFCFKQHQLLRSYKQLQPSLILHVKL